MIERIISLKKPMIFCATRMEYLVVCKGERCAADMLSMFENFHRSKEENVIRKKEEDRLYRVTVEDYHQKWSLKTIRSGLMNLYSKPTIIKNLDWLKSEKLIRVSNISNEGNKMQVEGKCVVFQEKMVQESINSFMGLLSDRPMPSEVMELIEKLKSRDTPPVKNLTPPCQKFDSLIDINTDNTYLEEKEIFEKIENSDEKTDAFFVKLIEEENLIELEKYITESVNEIFEQQQWKEYFIKKCKKVDKSVDFDKTISIYLQSFCSKFLGFDKKVYLLKKKVRIFIRFTQFVFDSQQFYNQNIKEENGNTNSKYSRNAQGGGVVSNQDRKPTKAERNLAGLFDS